MMIEDMLLLVWKKSVQSDLKSESYGMGLDNENEDDNEGDSVR